MKPEELLVNSTQISNGDGQQSTILLSENLQARNWFSTNFGDIGFGADVQLDVFRKNNTAPDYLTLTEKTLTAFDPRCFTNANRETAPEGKSPRPSSTHAGGVKILMADFRGKVMSKHIALEVYFQLLTWNGMNYGQKSLDDDDF